MENLQEQNQNNFTISKDITKGIFGNINTKFKKKDKWTSNEMKLFFHLIYYVQKNKKLELTLKLKDFERKLTDKNNSFYLSTSLGNIQSKSFL